MIKIIFFKDKEKLNNIKMSKKNRLNNIKIH